MLSYYHIQVQTHKSADEQIGHNGSLPGLRQEQRVQRALDVVRAASLLFEKRVRNGAKVAQRERRVAAAAAIERRQ